MKHAKTPWFIDNNYIIIIIVLIVLAAIVVVNINPLAVDFWCCFHPIARDYPQGQVELYSAANYGVFHPPWVVWMLIPFGFLSFEVGEFLIRWLSVVFIIVATVIITRDRREFLLGSVFALFNLHTFDLIYRGQITGFNALGTVAILIAYIQKIPLLMGLGYVFLTISIPNALPFGLVFMGFTFVDWKRSDFLKSLVFPIGILLLSFITEQMGYGPPGGLKIC